MVGWKIKDGTLNGNADAQKSFENLKIQRRQRILDTELDAWRAAGLEHKRTSPGKAAREREEAQTEEAKRASDRRQAADARDVRTAARAGQVITPKKTPTAPEPETEYDDRNGPRIFFDFVTAAVFEAKDMLVCLNCAGPTILAIIKHQDRDYNAWSLEHALWREFVLVAQGRDHTPHDTPQIKNQLYKKQSL